MKLLLYLNNSGLNRFEFSRSFHRWFVKSSVKFQIIVSAFYRRPREFRLKRGVGEVKRAEEGLTLLFQSTSSLICYVAVLALYMLTYVPI